MNTMNEKTISICGKQVRMRYCAATETGFEDITGRPVTVFFPDKDTPAEASRKDYIILAFAAIAAAYGSTNEEPPITADDIQFKATATEIAAMLVAVAELRNAWYGVSPVIKPEKSKGDAGKNA